MKQMKGRVGVDNDEGRILGQTTFIEYDVMNSTLKDIGLKL